MQKLHDYVFLRNVLKRIKNIVQSAITQILMLIVKFLVSVYHILV